jgi:ankyrin repeat protein
MKKQLYVYLLIFLSATQLLGAQPTRIATLKKNIAQKVRTFRDKAKTAVKEHPLLIAYGCLLTVFGVEVLVRNRQRLQALLQRAMQTGRRPQTGQGAGAGVQQPIRQNVVVNPVVSGGTQQAVVPGDVQREECSICFMDLVDNVGALGCNHTFHLACINRWLGDRNTCPLCRARAEVNNIRVVAGVPRNEAPVVNAPAEVPRPVAAVDVNARDGNGQTALMRAIVRLEGRVARENFLGLDLRFVTVARGVDMLLRANPGIDVNIRDNNGRTALMLAAVGGHREVVDRLLQVRGIDVNMPTRIGETALMQAAERGHGEVVDRLLLVPGIDVDVRNNQGQTALDLARANGYRVIDGNRQVVHYFEVYARVFAAEPRRENGGVQAVNQVPEAPQPQLQRVNEFRNVRVGPREQELRIAAEQGDMQALNRLLQTPDINVNAADGDGRTALMLAVRNGYDEVMNRLLQEPTINVNAQAYDGTTILMQAVTRRRRGIVNRLLQVPGIDLNVRRNDDGMTALEIARLLGYHDISVVLLGHELAGLGENR